MYDLLLYQMSSLLEGYRFGSRTGTSVLLKLDQVQDHNIEHLSWLVILPCDSLSIRFVSEEESEI